MKKIILIFIVLAIVTNSFAVVSTLQKAHQTAKEAEEQITQADKNIKEAQNLLNTGAVDQAKEAVKKAADLSAKTLAKTKEHIQTIATASTAAKEATHKVEDIAATTSQSKQLTQEVKNSVKKVQDATKEIHNIVGQAVAAVKNVQEAHATDNVSQAKKHTDNVSGLLQDLEHKIKEFFENIKHLYEKAKNADEAAKTQIRLVSPSKDVKAYGPRVRTVVGPEAVDVEWD